jgi:glycogen debranching enzyme
MTWDEWISKCHVVLEGNQIESRGFRYTRPAPITYEYQWLWDSCFHAITYRWFDPAMAQAELLSLVEHQVTQGDDAGMIPHMAYWNGDGSELWGRVDRSIITQPPLIGVAAMLVHKLSGDKALLEKLFPRLVAYHDWFDRRRDPDGDHLVSLIHPWEPGCDASPRWDVPMKLSNPTPDESKAARHGLVKDLIRYNCDAQALAEAGFFHVEAVDFNAIRAADLEALAQIAVILGESPDRWLNKAKAVQQAIQDKMIQSDGIVVDLMGLDEQPIKQASSAPFYLLFGGCVDHEQAARLVKQMTAPRFWANYPISTTPSDDPLFSPHHYWRGNVWMSVNWLIYQGLRRYGFFEEASRLAEASWSLVEAQGFHEYFNPLTGEGYGPDQQSWTTLVLDMLATERGQDGR